MRPRPGAATSADARAVLRTATRDVHERLHRHPALSRLAQGTICRDEYRRLLARSYGFYAIVEPLVGLGGGLTALLIEDLADLGLPAEAVGDLPLCPAPLVGTDMAAMTGARYVLLGASLGGTVMARAIARNDGTSTLPVRFLTGLDSGDWTGFTATLDETLPDDSARARAAQAALAMFATYEEWMAA